MKTVPTESRVQFSPANRVSANAPKTANRTQPTVRMIRMTIITTARIIGRRRERRGDMEDAK